MVQGGISSEQGRSCGFECLEEEVRRKAVLSASQAGSTFPTAVLQSREELSFLHFQGKDSGSKCSVDDTQPGFFEKEKLSVWS